MKTNIFLFIIRNKNKEHAKHVKTNSSSLDRITYNIYYIESSTVLFRSPLDLFLKRKKKKLERNNKIKNYVDYFYFLFINNTPKQTIKNDTNNRYYIPILLMNSIMIANEIPIWCYIKFYTLNYV